MEDLKYPKAQAFLDAHPNMSIDEAIKYLDNAIKKTDPDAI